MLFGTVCDDADDIPPQYCTIPILSCIINVYTTLRLCRLLLASAFDLVNPAFSRGRGARRKRDPSMQPHAHIRPAVIYPCYVRKLNRRIPFSWMVGTRLDAHCRLRGGLFLPICEPSALLQAAYAMICHIKCVSAASICAGPSESRHHGTQTPLPDDPTRLPPVDPHSLGLGFSGAVDPLGGPGLHAPPGPPPPPCVPRD